MHHVSFFTETTLIEIGVYRDRWGDPPKRVARFARSDNPPSRGQILPCKWLVQVLSATIQ